MSNGSFSLEKQQALIFLLAEKDHQQATESAFDLPASEAFGLHVEVCTNSIDFRSDGQDVYSTGKVQAVWFARKLSTEIRLGSGSFLWKLKTLMC